MKFDFSILKEMEKSIDQGITDLIQEPTLVERRKITDLPTSMAAPSPQKEEETIVRPDSFISTEGLTYRPLPPANQFIIDTLF